MDVRQEGGELGTGPGGHATRSRPGLERIASLRAARRALDALDLGAFHEAARRLPGALDGSLGRVALALVLYDLLLEAAVLFRRGPVTNREREAWLLALAEGERGPGLAPAFRGLLRDVLPSPGSPCVRVHPLVARARAFIDDHHSEDVSLARVAARLGTTRSYLSTLFRRHCGITLTEYIHRVRVRRAIGLLRSGKDSLAEVAFAVGYRSYRHFHRSFRRLTGLAPKEWVRRARSGQRPPVPFLLPGEQRPAGESPVAEHPVDH